MDGNRIRLRQFPPRPDVDDGLHNAIAVVVDEREGARFVGDSKRELVVVYQADLFYL